ncbi:MAG: hypothetical protein ABI647_11945 [Gemmatimonadota bacterium]
MRRKLLIAAFLAAGCHHTPKLDVAAKRISWISFRWVTAGLDGPPLERATLVLDAGPILAGTSSLLQLDLAASGNMPVGFPYNSGAPPAGMLRPRGRFYGLIDQPGGRYTLAAPSRDSADIDAAGWEIGTVGLGLVERRVLLLDYPRNRLTILPDSEPLSETIAARARFTEVVLDPSRVLIPLRLGDEVLRRTVLDPALTPFPIWTTPDHWRAVTGRRGDEPGNQIYRLHSPGGELVFVGAPVAGPVSLGGVDLGRPEIVFLRDGPASARLESWPDATDAVVGNRLFADRFLLVLDLPKRRLGLVKAH